MLARDAPDVKVDGPTAEEPVLDAVAVEERRDLAERVELLHRTRIRSPRALPARGARAAHRRGVERGTRARRGSFDHGRDGGRVRRRVGHAPSHLYSGGAGIVDALRRLAEGGLAELRRDYFSYLERSLEEAPDFPDEPTREPLLRRGGYPSRPATTGAVRREPGELAARIEENARDERRELMWESRTMSRASWGSTTSGPRAPSGSSANATKTGSGSRTSSERVSATSPGLRTDSRATCSRSARTRLPTRSRDHAVEQDGLANWPPAAGDALVSPRDGSIRTQWCHGASGMVTSLGDLLTRTSHWRPASRLARGAACEGREPLPRTAGNGYAFLTLFARTGDERWLARARAFAMHAIEQVERMLCARPLQLLARAADQTAVYLADCTRGGGAIPLP